MHNANNDCIKATGNDSWPTISIIVPVHNESKVLGKTLESLQAQVYPGPAVRIIAALNGCMDDSRRIALEFGVQLVESDQSGISFGRNLGATKATGEILVFVDADTTLPPCAIRLIAEAMLPYPMAVLGVRGRPQGGGVVVRTAFALANLYTCYKKVSPPGAVSAIHRELFMRLGGFDEKLPQGTNTDLIMRARAAGARYLCPGSFKSTTSIRRFEKVGVVRQMLAWRANHRDIKRGLRAKVEARDYGNVR